MPDSVGKRQRRDAKAKKAAAREDRRLARAKRQADREAGLIEAGTPIQPSEPAALGLLPRDDQAATAVEGATPDSPNEPAGDQA